MRALVVDGDPSSGEELRKELARHGHVVVVTTTGMDGLLEAVHGNYDVVLLDLLIRDMSGYEVLRRMRQQRVWTPVLVVSAKDGEYDEADAFDLGADDYLTRPFSTVVLLARLRALLRRGAPPRPVELRVGDLVLDPARREVRRGEREIRLTSREFSVLEFLMRHRGDVVSKSDLLGAVWDAEYAGNVNTVELYIGYLRKKVDVPFGRASIETVRGSGYRLADDPAEDTGPPTAVNGW